MGCNCNKKASAFIWTGDKGQKAEYRTEIEARAQVIRSGGSYAAKK